MLSEKLKMIDFIKCLFGSIFLIIVSFIVLSTVIVLLDSSIQCLTGISFIHRYIWPLFGN